MTPEHLRQIVEDGESFAVEFKGESRAPFSDKDLVETVVCLANRGGGGPACLVIGVENDRQITGARPRHGDRTDLLRIRALIGNRTTPSLSVDAELVKLQGKDVLVIEVPEVRQPVGTTDGRYLRRVIGSRGEPGCAAFHFHEMQAMQADRGQLDYSMLVFRDIGWDDLDPLEFDRYRRSIRENRGRGDSALLDLDNLEIAKALGAVEIRNGTIAVKALGLLLFGSEQTLAAALPSHEVAFQVLHGVDVETNDFFRWPLLRVMEELEARLRARNREQEIQVGMMRVGVPDYSPRAFREGVANALIHRDYSRLGAVHVQLREDRIEISSPGGFPDGVRLDNLLVTPPRPRNPMLADAMKRAGIVERTARGIDAIFTEQVRNGRPAPSYERSTDSGVILALPGGEPNLDFVRLVVEEGRQGRPPSLDGLLILNNLTMSRRINTAEAAQVIQKPAPEARNALEVLVETGLVEARGERRGRAYQLSAAVYRGLGEPGGYVRQSGFEPLQQEQLVLRYVKENGRITRGMAADLCRIDPRLATRLLGKLVRRGALERHGERRGSWYSLPGSRESGDGAEQEAAL